MTASPLPARRAFCALLASGAGLWPSAVMAQHAGVTPPADDSPPLRAPRYLLQAHNGRTVTSEDFRGRFQLIAFGFISCPDVCPTTMLELQQLLAALGPKARHVQALFVTVDPARDKLEILAAYTEAFDRRILGLTGSEALIRRAADAFKVVYEKVQEPGAPPDVYTMNHSAGIAVLGPQGQWIGRLGYGLPVAEMVARLSRWLEEAGY